MIGKSPKNQEQGKVCKFCSKCGKYQRRRFRNIFETRKSSNQSLENKFYKMYVNIGRLFQLKSREVIKKDKHGKLGKVYPFSLKSRQSARVLIIRNSSEFPKNY